jgi:3D (Asp-Asp-Asp) domain-containing protein
MPKILVVSGVLLLSGLASAASAQEPRPSKRPIEQLLARSCEVIAANAREFRVERIRRSTQYFTPLFLPGPDGKLRREDRRACLNVEGSCIVGDFLYNFPNSEFRRSSVKFKFGKGSGQSSFNTTNALDPCRTLAADRRFYPMGTVIYIPAMKGQICPQSGKAVDGCFIVGDVGSAITGGQRFDIFTGECSRYSKQSATCSDPANSRFVAAAGTPFHVVPRDDPRALALRREADAFIERDWR